MQPINQERMEKLVPFAELQMPACSISARFPRLCLTSSYLCINTCDLLAAAGRSDQTPLQQVLFHTGAPCTASGAHCVAPPQIEPLGCPAVATGDPDAPSMQLTAPPMHLQCIQCTFNASPVHPNPLTAHKVPCDVPQKHASLGLVLLKQHHHIGGDTR